MEGLIKSLIAELESEIAELDEKRGSSIEVAKAVLQAKLIDLRLALGQFYQEDRDAAGPA